MGEPNRGVSVARLEIVRVHVGPADLSGKSFEDKQMANDRRGEAAVKPFEVGEEGLWVLYLSGDRYVVGKAPENSGWPVWRRCRVSDECGGRKEAFAAVEAAAEAMEKVENAKPGQRFGLLREYAGGENRPMTDWALTALSNLKTDEADKHLADLAATEDAKLPLPTQLLLDQLLTRRSNAEWVESKGRAARLRAWVKGKRSDEEATAILSRLYTAHQDHTLTDKQSVELTRTAGENKDWSVTMRGYVIRQMGFVVGFCASDEARSTATDWLFEQVRSNDTVELRRHAAGALFRVPLPPARLKAIEEHLASEKDEKVVESLRAAVKKAKEMK